MLLLNKSNHKVFIKSLNWTLPGSSQVIVPAGVTLPDEIAGIEKLNSPLSDTRYRMYDTFLHSDGTVETIVQISMPLGSTLLITNSKEDNTAAIKVNGSVQSSIYAATGTQGYRFKDVMMKAAVVKSSAVPAMIAHENMLISFTRGVPRSSTITLYVKEELLGEDVIIVYYTEDGFNSVKRTVAVDAAGKAFVAFQCANKVEFMLYNNYTGTDDNLLDWPAPLSNKCTSAGV